MKKTVIVLLMGLLPLLAVGQTRTNLNPKYGARVSSINRVAKVEVTDTSTNLYFHIDFIAGWYIVVSDKSYIRVGNDGPKLPMKSHQGIAVGLNANWTMPASGSADYMMSFPRVDDAAVTIDFIDEGSSGNGWNIYDIEINPRSSANQFPEKLLGNWLKTDGSNEWVAGFFEKTVAYDTDFWSYQAVAAQDGVVHVTLNNNIATKKLVLTSGKNGRLTITEDGKQPIVCSQTKQQVKGFKYPDQQLKPYNGKPGVAVLNGIIHPYSPKMGFTKGLFRVSDAITGKDSELLVSVANDGTFEVEVPLNHPVRCWIHDIGNIWRDVYVEPGVTTLVYINQESHIKFAVTDQQRANAKLNDLYMGPNAAVNTTLLATDTISYFNRAVDRVLPLWVKLKRSGNHFISFTSNNGTDWRRVGDTLSVAMPTDVMAGLCVTSHKNEALCHATFSQVKVNNAVPKAGDWKSADIGGVNIGGKTKIKGDTYTVSASGNDIWDQADAFRFVYLPFSGDGEVVAKVDAYNQPNYILKVGVMVRESLQPGAKYVMSAACPAYHSLAQVRDENDGWTRHFTAKPDVYQDLDLTQFAAFRHQVTLDEEQALADLQAKSALHPIGVDLVRIRMQMDEVGDLLGYNFFRRRKKQSLAEEQKIPFVPEQYQWLDSVTIRRVHHILNDPLSFNSDRYGYCLSQMCWYFTGGKGVLSTVALPMLFDELAGYGLTFTAEEKEWMDWTRQRVAGETVPADSPTVASMDVVEKQFNVKYEEYISLVRTHVFYKRRIAPVESNIGVLRPEVKERLLLLDLIYCLDYSVKPWTEPAMAIISNMFTEKALYESLVQQNEALNATIAANQNKTGYVVRETPKTEGDKLFDAIMEKYRGKLVYVDFWATWCGPCRYGIERIAPLKEELEGKDVAFVYITGETSPLTTYQNSIPNIKGDHYRVSDDEWKILKAKFNVSGIPHYVLVGKDGAVINPNLPHHDNDGIRKMLFKYL